MDISPEYIKMCEQATEIQNERLVDYTRQNGDYFYSKIIPWNRGVSLASHYEHYLKYHKQSSNPDTNLFIYCRQSTDCSVKQDWPDQIGIGFVWLPRQDQLQGMVVFKSIIKVDDIYIKIERFYQFVNDVMGDFGSVEQLWLSFVMYEKYKKKWNGEDWR